MKKLLLGILIAALVGGTAFAQQLDERVGAQIGALVIQNAGLQMQIERLQAQLKTAQEQLKTAQERVKALEPKPSEPEK